MSKLIKTKQKKEKKKKKKKKPRKKGPALSENPQPEYDAVSFDNHTQIFFLHTPCNFSLFHSRASFLLHLLQLHPSMADTDSDADAVNTLRILVATDCHLGYMEKDEIRRHDSFQAFEEICSIADRKRVDFLLLAGDLFHENKPSRSTLVKAIEILRRHCLNDRPVPFQVVSDQTLNFQNSSVFFTTLKP